MILKTRHITFVASLFVGLPVVYAQQQPQFSHYMFTTMLFNPAYAGFQNAIDATLIHRQQWYGLDGAPQTTGVSVSAPIAMINSGIGVTLTSDRIGFFNNTNVNLAYSYQFSIGEGTLGVGLQAGLRDNRLKLTDAKPPTEGPDPVLTNKEDVSDMLFALAAGVYYKIPDRYEVGLSMGDLNEAQSDNLAYQTKRCLNITGNYRLNVDMLPNMDFVPSTLIKTDFVSTQIDLSLIGLYNKTYWGGLSYRWKSDLAILGGAFIKQVQVGIAYDLAVSSMIRSSKIGGGFEVFVKYNFNLSVDRLPKSYKNSRFL
ncbi:membrane protein [Bacteroidia bacterium]|nr:membrane protein [Bacteroidia bacterium]